MVGKFGDWADHFGVHMFDERVQGKIANDNNFVNMLEGVNWQLLFHYHLLYQLEVWGLL